MMIETDTILFIQRSDISKDLGYSTKRLKTTIQDRPSQEMNSELLAPLLFWASDGAL